jgi:MiaB/RimO family radical SAM methylthiotransferase
MKVYIESVESCPLRSLDAEKIRKYFEINDCEIVCSSDDSDVNILNSCAFLASFENHYLNRIRELSKKRGELIVTGCLKKISPKKYNEAFKGRGYSVQELDRIDDAFPNFRHTFKDVKHVGECENLFDAQGIVIKDNELAGQNKKTKWFIAVSEGCEKKRHCSYCVIWKSTGEYKSKPLEECIASVRKGIEEGHESFHIIDSGAYGTDLGFSFPMLIWEIIKIEGVNEIVLQAMNPSWIMKYKEELARLVKTGKIKAIRYGQQSGSDRILKLMNRECSVQDISDCIKYIKKAYPQIKIIAQLMAGFPSETEEDFEQTARFVKNLGIDDADIFMFEAREGTPAYSMPGQVSLSIIRQREKRLRELFEK